MYKVMLDLETMGNKPGAAIIAIGAVFFGKEGLGAEFEARITLASAVECGLKMDVSTVMWWMEQSKEAQLAVMRPGRALPQVLTDLSTFVFQNCHSEVEVWGNGSDFDNVLLIRAYEVCGMTPPWKFYKGRCFRTLKNLPGVPAAPKFEGLKHDALADAKHQARHANLILAHLDAK